MTSIEQIIDIYEAAKKRDRNFNEKNYVWLLGCDVVDELRHHIYLGNTLNGIEIKIDYAHKRKIILAARAYRARSYSGYYNNPGTYEIKNVIFNDPATIVIWADGTKTVVKTQDGEKFDAEKGLAMAISKKALGNKGNYFEEFKKYCLVESNNVISVHPDNTVTEKSVVCCTNCKYIQVAYGNPPCNDCDDYDEFEPK